MTQRSVAVTGRPTLLPEDRVLRAPFAQHLTDRPLGGHIGLGDEIGRAALGRGLVHGAKSPHQHRGRRPRRVAGDGEQLGLEVEIGHLVVVHDAGRRTAVGHSLESCAAMAAADTVAALTGFAGRGGGTDAERRAARWLAGEIAGTRRRTAQVDTFWSRPDWALAHAWHVALALAGSLVSIGSPTIGGALVLAALACMAARRVDRRLAGAAPVPRARQPERRLPGTRRGHDPSG